MQAPVAQWIRALVFGTKGRGFESLRARQFLKLKVGFLAVPRVYLQSLSNILSNCI